MELIGQFIDIVLHLDKYLAALLAQYGAWVYAILFLIVFCETGLVVTPFLPGDSLLFVAGTLAATVGQEVGFDIRTLIVVLMAAAVIGDNTNYWIGRWVGPRVFHWENSRLFNRAAFEKTHAFYERHGGKTMVVARFLPLVRTFAPFVAGVGAMDYRRFFLFDLLGAVLWVFSMTLGGYWFGNIPVIRQNLSLLVVAIVGLSLVPVALTALSHKFHTKQ